MTAAKTHPLPWRGIKHHEHLFRYRRLLAELQSTMTTPNDGENIVHLGAIERELLPIIPKGCGLTTNRIAAKLGRTFGHNQRTYSGWVLSHLLRLEQKGLIFRLDDEKPIAWTILLTAKAAQREGEKL